jgi:hypothetical protein
MTRNMKRFESYRSFIVASVREAAVIQGVKVTRKWRIGTRDDPTSRHWCNADGYFHCEHKYGDQNHRSTFPEDRPCQEIVIHASSPETASNVSSLIYGGILLGYPDTLKSPPPHEPFPVDDTRDDLLNYQPFMQWFQFYEAVHYGCLAAESAWNRSELIYAIEKYKLSLSLDSFTPHSSHPRHGQIFRNERDDFAYHTSAAFAIIAAFAAIEELGLDIRSSPKNPRFVPPRTAAWNPKVRADLKVRLAAAGIDGDEEFQWIQRGRTTQLQKRIQPKLGRRAPYSNRFRVRDQEVTLIDAIHYVSYIRNYVVAHKFGESVKAISPYDVHNAQLLTRRLLLGSLDLWKKFTDV